MSKVKTVFLTDYDNINQNKSKQVTCYLTGYQLEQCKKLLEESRFLSLSELIRTAVNNLISDYGYDQNEILHQLNELRNELKRKNQQIKQPKY